VNLAATANVFELAWVAVGLTTGAVNSVLWVIAVRDLQAVYRMAQNGAKHIEAWTWFWAHLILVLGQVLAVAIGVFAALTPPANPAIPVSPVGMILSVGLITKQLVNCGLGIFLILRRGKLDAYIDGRLHARGELAADATNLAQHDETMAALAENTAVTVAARREASAAHVAAGRATDEAAGAHSEATQAKDEATQAHEQARVIIERIDEATSSRDEPEGGG
jgi:hypothetical protein